MISTWNADEQTMSTGRNPRSKPNMILEYYNRKKGIDLSDELASYYSPIRKTLTWYKKIAVDVLFGVGVINTVYLFNKLNQQNKCKLLQAQMCIVKNLLGINVLQTPVQPASAPSTSQAQHFLKQLDRKDGKITRRRCTGCYNEFRQGETSADATIHCPRNLFVNTLRPLYLNSLYDTNPQAYPKKWEQLKNKDPVAAWNSLNQTVIILSTIK